MRVNFILGTSPAYFPLLGSKVNFSTNYVDFCRRLYNYFDSIFQMTLGYRVSKSINFKKRPRWNFSLPRWFLFCFPQCLSTSVQEEPKASIPNGPAIKGKTSKVLTNGQQRHDTSNNNNDKGSVEDKGRPAMCGKSQRRHTRNREKNNCKVWKILILNSTRINPEGLLSWCFVALYMLILPKYLCFTRMRLIDQLRHPFRSLESGVYCKLTSLCA